MLKIGKDQQINILSIGTKILLKDVMDQYLRSLGEVKTFYASKLSSAVESYNEKKPQIIFCEQFFPEGGALDFIHSVNGLSTALDQYFVLATENSDENLVALAVEKNVDEILVKPFSTENIHQIVERFLEKKDGLRAQAWVQDLKKAREAYQAKRFQEAEQLYFSVADKHPQQALLQLEAAEFFYERRNYAISHQIVEKLLQKSPANARALHVDGLCLKKSGKFKEAIERFSKAHAVSPLNNHRNVEMADTYFQLAEEQIQLALRADEENSQLILSKGKIFYLRKEFTNAVNYLDSKRAFLSETGKKEADALSMLCKKLGGIK